MASLDIVIVNWNTGDALRTCLQSIAEGATGVDLQRVAVVDNASADDSMARASAAYRYGAICGPIRACWPSHSRDSPVTATTRRDSRRCATPW